jgi:hypothetical protein
MSKLTLTLAGILALAGCASAPTRSLRFDATDHAAFEASLTSFKQELPSYNWQLLGIALGDIWDTTKTEAAPTLSAEDIDRAFFARLNGLTYREIVALADVNPPTTRQKYWAAHPSNAALPGSPASPQSGPPGGYGVTSYNSQFPMYPSGFVPRGDAPSR